jgi:hypothetical protein
VIDLVIGLGFGEAGLLRGRAAAKGEQQCQAQQTAELARAASTHSATRRQQS